MKKVWQTHGQTDRSVVRAAWLQLKTIPPWKTFQHIYLSSIGYSINFSHFNSPLWSGLHMPCPSGHVIRTTRIRMRVSLSSLSSLLLKLHSMQVSEIFSKRVFNETATVYPKKYAHGFCFAVLCCGYTLTDFSISIRLTSLALWQSNDCPSASKATLMNMDKYFMWIHYKRLHNHNIAKHNKTVCLFLGIYCM